jgi:sialidase-1
MKPFNFFMKTIIFSIICGLLLTHAQVNAQSKTPLFKSGEGGYKCFRIPAIITTTKGALLAIAEGRWGGCSDTGDIDMVMKRSFDGGKTWSNLTVIWNDANNTCGNPTIVEDKKNNRIIVLSTWNLGSDHEKQIIAGTSQDTRRIFTFTSDNEGETWSAPREITSAVKKI